MDVLIRNTAAGHEPCSRAALPLPLWLALIAGGCVPTLDVDESALSQEPRLLAVVATPAEARAGEAVQLRAFFANQEGLLDQSVDWSVCTTRKPLAELGPVATRCIEAPDTPFATGSSVSATLPSDACRLFGPELPAPSPGEPAARAIDPDATGGYYVPVIATVGEERTLAEVRVECGLAGASQSVTADYARRDRVNRAPELEALDVLLPDGSWVEWNDTLVLPRNTQLALRPRIPTCPLEDVCGDGVCGPDDDTRACDEDCSTPIGCAGAERYVRFDAATRTLKSVYEGVRVAWYVAGGTLERAGSGAREGEGELGNSLVATGEEVVLIVVVRDDRGGASIRERRASTHD
jgi:hypothetical protein